MVTMVVANTAVARHGHAEYTVPINAVLETNSVLTTVAELK